MRNDEARRVCHRVTNARATHWRCDSADRTNRLSTICRFFDAVRGARNEKVSPQKDSVTRVASPKMRSAEVMLCHNFRDSARDAKD
jgi:hypothetical protein